VVYRKKEKRESNEGNKKRNVSLRNVLMESRNGRHGFIFCRKIKKKKTGVEKRE